MKGKTTRVMRMRDALRRYVKVLTLPRRFCVKLLI